MFAILAKNSTGEGGPLGRRPFFRPGFSKVMSWAQQREAIRIAAEAGVRAGTSAAGSETLPLTHHHLRYAMLSRPNGELTRAGQYYYQLIDRPPPSRQYDRNQPLNSTATKGGPPPWGGGPPPKTWEGCGIRKGGPAALGRRAPANKFSEFKAVEGPLRV